MYGPGQSPSYAGVVSRFIECALRGSKLVIYGDGLQTRDFIHVVDVARAVEQAIQRQVHGEVLNIGSGKPVSIRELAEVVKKNACPVEHQPPRPGEIRHSHADISRAKRILGYQPSISLEDGIRELVEVTRREHNI